MNAYVCKERQDLQKNLMNRIVVQSMEDISIVLASNMSNSFLCPQTKRLNICLTDLKYQTESQNQTASSYITDTPVHRWCPHSCCHTCMSQKDCIIMQPGEPFCSLIVCQYNQVAKMHNIIKTQICETLTIAQLTKLVQSKLENKLANSALQ